MSLTNVEGILLAALKADPRVAELVGDQVHTKLPTTKKWPAIRVTRFGGDEAVERWLDNPDVQIDVWARRQSEAFDLSVAVVDVINSLAGVHPLGVVTKAKRGAVSYQPDDVFDPAIPRYIIDVQLWAHPIQRD